MPMTAGGTPVVQEGASVRVSWLPWLVAAVWISCSRPTLVLAFNT
jgi:hypothetical protein